MAQYVVKPGDTLSNIGQQFGVDWKTITGYKSGNPNLIYPGEVLSIGGTAPTPTVAPPTVAPPIIPQAGPAPITTESDYGQVVLDAINKYMASQQAQAPIKDVYTQYRESLGIPGMETTQAGLTGQVTNVEGLLNKLESDINARASAIGGVATEAQLRRRQVAEAKPLREQLTDLYRSQVTGQTGLTSARQELATMMQLEEQARAGEKESALGMLPYYQEALKKPAAPEAPTMKEWGGRMYQWDGTKWVDVGTSTTPTTTGGQLPLSDSKIRDWILENKRANSNIPYEDLWGQLADEMKKQGLNPTNYDELFWEILHPEGKAGYQKYVKGTTTKTTKNPFE